MARTLLLGLALGLAAFFFGCNTSGEKPDVDHAAIAEALAVGLSPLAKEIRNETLAVLPNKPKRNNLFDVYNAQSDAAWALNWTRKIDFTGVAWDTAQNATLISPRHVVMAAHSVRSVGDAVVFHDSRGNRVVRILIEIEKLKTADIAVGLLESEVDLTYYRVLAPSETLPTSLEGAFAFVTDKERRLHVHEIRAVHGNNIQFRHSPALHKVWWENLIAGDSGNPSFLLVDGELLLLETHTSGGAGAGPFYSSADNVAAINEAMARLGGGHQLTLAR